MNKEPCERCKGEGTIEKNIPGNEGVPEMDVEIFCPDCGGSGKQEDVDGQNRIIKFRAWTKEEMIYEGWNKNFFVNKEIIFRYDNVMQFTGLKDKTGKEIYEGDIVRVFEEDEWDDETAIKDFAVEWGDDYPAFTLKGYPDLEYNSLQHATLVISCEVIGNIYENAELIKEAEMSQQ